MHASLPSRRSLVGALVAATLCLAGLAINAPPAGAAPALAQYVLNPTGGVQADGSDGLRFVVNPAGRSEQFVFANQWQYCCSSTTMGSGGPVLRVGSTAFGFNSGAWTSIEQLSIGGSTNGSATGDATLALEYKATTGGRDYLLERTVTYTFPNQFVRESYTVTIPTGNTDEVKLFYASDTAPGSNDAGIGRHFSSPVDAVYSVNPVSGVQVGMREVAGGRQFDGAVAVGLGALITALGAGDLGGFTADDPSPGTHDASAAIQWNLGATPGELTAAFDLGVGNQETALTAAFADTTVAAGTSTDLQLEVANTRATTTTGGTFTVTLPTGLAVASGGVTGDCGGTVTAAVGSSTVSLAGGTIAAAANCVIEVPVVAASGGTYTITNASAVASGGIANRVPTIALTVTAPPTTTTTTAAPAPAPPPPPTTIPPTTTTLPPPPPPPPVAPPTIGTGTGSGTGSGTGGGAPAALFIDEGGAANDVPLPPGTPTGDVAAASALGPDDSIAVTPGGQVFTSDPGHKFGELPVGTALRAPITNLAVDWQLRDTGAAAFRASAVAWTPSGYWLVAGDGGVFTYGSARYHGSLAGRRLRRPIIGIAPTPSRQGYWLVAGDGGVFAFGDARFYGSAAGRRLGGPIVGIMPTPSGRGYSLVGADGGVLTFGDARFHGSQGTGGHAVIGGALTSTGAGYWLVRDDRVLVPFGDARRSAQRTRAARSSR